MAKISLKSEDIKLWPISAIVEEKNLGFILQNEKLNLTNPRKWIQLPIPGLI